jgi:hypothetical protein
MLINKNLGMFTIVALLFATVVIFRNPIQSAAAISVEKGGIKGANTFTISGKHCTGCRLAVSMALSGNNLYMAWPNNDTGHWNIFFAKSTDGGKTLKTMMISAPNKGKTIDQITEIAASGSNVYVTWWTNKTGVQRCSQSGGIDWS